MTTRLPVPASVRDVAHLAGLSPFSTPNYSGTRSAAAAEVMGRRSPYYTPGTLRFFGASVLRLRTVADGMALVALERIAIGGQSNSVGYRVVVHDLTGRVISPHRELDTLPTRITDALEAEWLAAQTPDAWEVLHNAILDQRMRLTRELAHLDEAAAYFAPGAPESKAQGDAA